MAAPYEKGIPGAVNTDFGQAPGFNQTLGRELAAPGLDARPRVQRLEQLRSVLLTAGAGAAGAAMSEARVAEIARRRRDERIEASRRLSAQVLHRKEAELDGQSRQYQENMKSRLGDIEQEQFRILRDARSTNAEWVMNEAVLRQQNTGSDVEQSAWNDFIIRYQGQARNDVTQTAERVARESNRRLTDDSILALKTAKRSVDVLATDINSNAELQQEMIGDGRGIAERVYDYVYQAAVASAPDLFDLKKNDPQYAEKKRAGDDLLLEMESWAHTTIVKPLVRKASEYQQKASEISGYDLIEAHQLAYAEGRVDAEEYHDTIGVVTRGKFTHLDAGQQDELRTKMYRTQFERLVAMLDQDDPGETLTRIEGLLSLADLSDPEKNEVRQTIINDKFPKAVANKLSQEFASAQNALAGVAPGPLGYASADPRRVTLSMLRNPNGEPDGPTRYMDIASQMLDKLGIQPGTELTPLQANLQMAVLGEVEKAEAGARQLQSSIDRKVDVNANLMAGGLLTGDQATKAWTNGWSTAAMSGGLRPDDPVYQNIATVYRQETGEEIPWDGSSPLVLNADTAKLGELVARADAAAWRDNLATPFPKAMADQVYQSIAGGNEAQARWALTFFHALGPEGQQRLASKVGSGGRDAVWANAVLVEGSRMAFTPRDAEQNRSFSEVVNRMRSITESLASGANTRAITNAGLRFEQKPDFADEADRALERALKSADGFGVRGEGDNPEARLLNTLGNDREELGALYQRAYIVQALNPGTTLDTAMSQVVGEMRAQGYTTISTDKGRTLARDPYGHSFYDGARDRNLTHEQRVKLTASPADQYSLGMQRMMSTPMPSASLKEYGKAIEASDDQIAWAKGRADMLLYRVLEDREKAKNGPQAFLPPPEQWSWRASTPGGPDWDRAMSSPNGGVPMQLSIPGLDTFPQWYHRGAPLHTFSARRVLADHEVDRTRIVDNHLSSQEQSLSVIPTKPDMARRLQMESVPMAGGVNRQ